MRNPFKKSLSCLLFLLLFSPISTKAETILEDIELNLSIEVQDTVVDFEDAGETIEKERQVIYALEVKNTGPGTHHDLTIFMGEPHYMTYIKGSTTISSSAENLKNDLPDQADMSPLFSSYLIETLSAGEILRFEIGYQVQVPPAVKDDPLYTVAFASLTDPYSAMPLMSAPVQSTISGEAKGSLSVNVFPDPPTTQTIFSGSQVTYAYQITNGGGLPLDEVNLVTHLPAGTDCIESCGSLFLSDALEPSDSITVDMKVKVKTGLIDKKTIENIGFDLASSSLSLTEVRDPIIHTLNAALEVGTNDFKLITEQVPNLVLNSPDRNSRPDQGDRSETQYALKYTGRGKSNTYQLGGTHGVQDTGQGLHEGYCSNHSYPHGKQSTVYAYSSSGGGCDELSNCPLVSKPLQFLINTSLPKKVPRLITLSGDASQSKIYHYGDTSSINQFMRLGGVIKIPKDFMLSRAIENGVLGLVKSTVKSQSLTEDLWTYQFTGQYQSYDTCSCGEDCTHTDEYPVYTWQKTNAETLNLNDEDETNISVYSSTAWLKTKGGHLGTNGSIFNHNTEANQVPLAFGGGAYMSTNEYVHDPEKILSPSDHYTPVGESNGDRLIFSDNEAFSTSAGEAWQKLGTKFNFLERGQPYLRSNHPRDFEEDLLVQERFGPVKKGELPKAIVGNFDIEDNTVWHHEGDLNIGKVNGEAVIFKGGQSRFYVEGDVYINSDVFYDMQDVIDQKDITALRIDARNIYIHPEVQDLQLLLLSREGFYSGESHHQLRILGDVIAKEAYWQRKPVLDLQPKDINPPSEYLIEDYRKYILPPPGDTTLPDEYGWWQSVNAGKF